MRIIDYQAGLEPPVGTKNRRKDTWKIRINTAPGLIQLDLNSCMCLMDRLKVIKLERIKEKEIKTLPSSGAEPDVIINKK